MNMTWLAAMTIILLWRNSNLAFLFLKRKKRLEARTGTGRRKHWERKCEREEESEEGREGGRVDEMGEVREWGGEIKKERDNESEKKWENEKEIWRRSERKKIYNQVKYNIAMNKWNFLDAF